jgi:DNA processing protein
VEGAELAAWLRLALTPGIGNQAARRLLAAFAFPQAVFGQDAQALGHLVDARGVAALQSEPPALAAQLAATTRWLEQDPQRHALLSLGDPDYPAALLQIEDPPLLLWRIGRPDGADAPAVAVVGSRNPTPQGLQNARAFGRAFGEAGVTVVSGLALGIDGAAHEGALAGAAEGALATIAVVGTGLDRVYPRRHLALAHRIAERGLILSEYPLGTLPLAPNFPRRNRLISGLSLGVVVVEAELRSGSLITARLAGEQGREVFAVPGSPLDPRAKGTNDLIRQGAALCEGAEDVLRVVSALPLVREPGAPFEGAEPDHDGLDAAAGRLRDRVEALLSPTPIPRDELARAVGGPVAAVFAALVELAVAGRADLLPGGMAAKAFPED